MLSRVAQNFYWMGRYLERTDHLARYINVQYFSSLDSPDPHLQTLALKSIIDMVGLPEGNKEEPNIENSLVAAALDDSNPVSILSSVYAARENARSIREHLSGELWDAINNFYLFVSEYPVDVYRTKGLYDFTVNVMQHFSNVRGRIRYTLLKDVGWHFIHMGLSIERAAQTVRILISKLSDVNEIRNLKLASPLKNQQWNTTLDCLEAKDMCRRYYSALPNKYTALNFLLFNSYFPKSVVNNLTSVQNSLERIENRLIISNDSLVHRTGKIITPFNYMDVKEIDDDLNTFLNNTLKSIYDLSDMIVGHYFGTPEMNQTQSQSQS